MPQERQGMFEDKIKDLPNYSDIYIKCSTNYRVSAVKDHAKDSNGDSQHPHTVAYGNFLKANGIEIEQRANKIAKSCDKANIAIVSKLQIDNKMDPSTLTKTKNKFETAYFVVKQELPQPRSSGFYPENNGAKTLAGPGHVAPRSNFISCGVGCVNDVSCVACSQAHLIGGFH